MNKDKIQETYISKIAAFAKSWRLLIIFLGIMLIMTIISRINDQKLLPKVTTDSIKSMQLDHIVTIEGTVSHNHEKAVFIPQNLRIAAVNVSEGMYVKKGDILFQIDTKDLDDQIEKAESDAKKQKLQIEDKQDALDRAEKENETAVGRAREDYESINDKETLTLEQLKAQLDKLKDELDGYNTNPLSKRDNTVLNNLKTAYEDKKQAYNDMESSKASAISMAERNLEDAKNPDILEDKVPLIQKQLSDTNQELSVLTGYRQDNYKVRAGREGVIQTVSIKPGDTTGSSMAFLIYDFDKQADTAVFPEENLKIDSVFVEESDYVGKSDALYSVDRQSLDKRIEDLANEADQLSRQLSNEILSDASKAAIKERLIKRADEDYDRAVSEWNEKEAEADDQLTQAQEAFETYRDHPMETDVMKQAYTALEKEYTDKKNAYDLAVLNSENTVTVAKRNVENAQNTQVPDKNTAAVMQEDLSQMEKQVYDLEALKAKKGKISADVDGKITGLSITAGAVSGEGSAVLISNEEEGYRFNGLLSVEQSKYLNIGDTINLNIYHGNISMDDLTVTSIQALAEDAAHYSVMVQIPDKEKELDGTALLTVTKQTETYKNCVPLEAVHSKNGKSYVYILSEKNTVLGIQESAEQIEVTIIDKNERYAAVNAEFPEDAKVIVISNKALKDNSRVRRID